MAARPDTVLIIEDDDDVRAAFTELFQLQGYVVVGAADGLEALRRLRDGARPGLILLDLMMPNMDGAQFREAQLKDPGLAPIPVIVVSADASVAAKAAAVGATVWFRKPVDVSALFDAVSRLLA